MIKNDLSVLTSMAYQTINFEEVNLCNLCRQQKPGRTSEMKSEFLGLRVITIKPRDKSHVCRDSMAPR